MTIAWVDRYFVSAYTTDEAGVATLAAAETSTSGDPNGTIRGRYASHTTNLNANADILLPWVVAAGSVWGFDVYVTAKGTGIRRKVKIDALVYGNGATATIDGAVDVVVKGTGTPTATIVVSGSAAYLRLSPGTASTVLWFFEVHAQQL